MSTFKERLEQEAAELNEKIVRLQDFINSEKSNEIDKDHKGLLFIQVEAMRTYYQVLLIRLVDLDRSAKEVVSDDERWVFTQAAEPLVNLLKNKYHPHVKVVVDSNGAELVEGLLSTGAAFDGSEPAHEEWSGNTCNGSENK